MKFYLFEGLHEKFDLGRANLAADLHGLDLTVRFFMSMDSFANLRCPETDSEAARCAFIFDRSSHLLVLL